MEKRLLFLVLLLSVRLHAQTADNILEQHISSIGGENNWKKVKTLITSGEYDYGGTKFPFTAYSKAPNKYKFVVPFNGKYYAQGYDGTSGWKIDAFKNETKPTMLTGKEAVAMANEADVELESAFINYKSKGHQAVYEKDTTVNTAPCHKIVFTRKTGEKEFYYFDVKTFSLLMKRAVSKNSEMGGSVMNTLFSDYGEVSGITIPFKSASDVNGQAILTITIEKVFINPAIDDKEFMP